MEKVLVIGAGAQGGPCASILAKNDSVKEIRLGDINPSLLKAVQKRVGSDKVQPLELNAGDIDEVAKAAEGTDVIINLAPMKFNESIMQAALKSRVHYVDTAVDYSYLDQMVAGIRPLRYEEEFKAIGKTALLGSGMSPGICNVITRYVCDQMDTVDSIQIRMGTRLNGSDEIVKPWNPGWAPEVALDDYALPPMVFENGEYKKVAIFDSPETYTFMNDEVGATLIAMHSHEEPYTLPYYIGKGLKNVFFKYPVDTVAGAFVKMGFADNKEIEVQGTKISPKKVLLSLVPDVSDGFLNETEKSVKESTDIALSLEIQVEGSKAGQNIRHFAVLNTSSEETDINEYLFQVVGTTQIGVAFPAVAGTIMCADGKAETGVISCECLNPVEFFEVGASMGLPITLDEKKIIKKSFG